MISRFIRWLFSDPKPEAVPAVDTESKRESIFTTHIERNDLLTPAERLANITAKAFPRTIKDDFVFAGDGATLERFAMDEYDGSLKSIFALNQVGIPEVQATWYGSQGFIGYQMCALMGQHWLINKACLIPARDAVRKGYKLTVNDGSEIAPEVMDAINKANKRHRLNKTLVEYVKMGRVFGIRVALFKVDSDDPEYYTKPFNPDGIKPGTYRGISQIDPYWCVPELTSATASDPSSLDFYEPTYWIINNRRYHKSHLVIMRGEEVADILKPSYLYGGLSVPQKIYERVYAAERTANEAPQLALSKRSMIFYTDGANALANQQQFEERLMIWAQLRDNYGVKVADKEADQIEQHDTSLSDLDSVIMTQYQIVAAAANMPATKLLGTTPKGFNATGEYEAESYHEELESIQTNDMEPLIDRHMVCVIRSEICPRFGIEPFSVDCTWEPLDSMGSREAAEVRKINAEADKIYAIDIGAVDAHEIRDKLSADEQSGFSGLPTLTDEDDGNLEAPGADSLFGMDDEWITVHPNGGESTGQHVLLGEGGEVKAGMGGKFTGQKISDIGKKNIDNSKSDIHNEHTNNEQGKKMSDVSKVTQGSEKQIAYAEKLRDSALKSADKMESAIPGIEKMMKEEGLNEVQSQIVSTYLDHAKGIISDIRGSDAGKVIDGAKVSASSIALGQELFYNSGASRAEGKDLAWAVADLLSQ